MRHQEKYLVYDFSYLMIKNRQNKFMMTSYVCLESHGPVRLRGAKWLA